MTIPDDILIIGLGTTGIGVAKFLHRMGRRITIADEKSEETLGPALKALQGIDFAGKFGPHKQEDFLKHPMVVVSPGVDSELPYLKEARRKGIKVVGEMELAYTLIQEPIIAITGTNGKTTVTTLIGEIFRKAYEHVFVGGNIGNPLINYVLEGEKADYIVLEVSSFQLETIETFRPQMAVLLNITEDHLDRYRSYQEYKDAKYRIFENQTEQDWAVMNQSFSPEKEIKARRLHFSAGQEVENGAFAENGAMHVRLGGKELVYRRDLSPLVGIHNTENLLVALLTAHAYGIRKDMVEEVVSRFTGLPHRVEFVRQIAGVRYYNDSKATNVDATKRALEGMDSGVILIAGGKDKGGSYKAIEHLMNRVKALIVIGEAKERILRELGSSGPTYVEKNLKGAVEKARETAGTGDVVLFSPMCSSFDMFRDYKERGNTFKTIVESL
jgi:UDP-N-acetylmuramoylalanine--D-glutamate ligase